MTEPIVSWQEKQKENKLADTDLSYKVKRRIIKWQKQSDLIPEIKQSIANANEELIPHADKPNGHAYKRIKNSIADMETLLADTEQEVSELNSVLCSDMDRLVRDAEKNKKNAERLRGLSSGKGAASANPEPTTATASEPAAEDTITDDMKTDLQLLRYTKEDIEAMDFATASGILTSKKAKVTTAPAEPASIPVMITNAMRQQLQQLGYSKEDVDAMKPEDANEILAAGTAKPGEATGKEEPGPAQAHGGTVTGNSQTPTVVKIKPAARTEPDAGNKKKNQNAVLVGVGTALSFVLGIFIGRRLK